MPYISELLNNEIHDSSEVLAGKLKDILIRPKTGVFPPLEFLEVQKSENKEMVYVPYDFVANFTSSKITLKTIFNKIALPALPESDFIYLKRDVLDKQIVDVAGTRVVRVNDLRIGFVENKMCVLGIDPSFKGLLRRLNLDETLIGRPFKVKLIDWRQAGLLNGVSGASLQLKIVSENLSKLHPADLANIVEDLDIKHGSSLLASLDEHSAAKVLEEVNPHLQNVLIKYLGPENAGKILSQMSSDEFTDLVKGLSNEEAKKFLSKIESPKTEKVEKLIEYSDNTAGGLMTLDFVSVRPNWRVSQAVEEIKKLSSGFRSIVFIYVTDENGKFFGVVSLRRLLISDPGTIISQMAKALPKTSTLKPVDKIQKVIRIMTKYNLFTAAVVDDDGRLAGVVTIDDVMRLLYPDA